MTSKVDNVLKNYSKKFEDGFPMIPLGWGRTDEEIIEIAEACIKAGKDVYEMGYLSEDDGDY